MIASRVAEKRQIPKSRRKKFQGKLRPKKLTVQRKVNLSRKLNYFTFCMPKISSFGRGFWLKWILRSRKQASFRRKKNHLITYIRINSTCELSIASWRITLKILRALESVDCLKEITFSFNSTGAWKNALNKQKLAENWAPHCIWGLSCQKIMSKNFAIFLLILFQQTWAIVHFKGVRKNVPSYLWSNMKFFL